MQLARKFKRSDLPASCPPSLNAILSNLPTHAFPSNGFASRIGGVRQYVTYHIHDRKLSQNVTLPSLGQWGRLFTSPAWSLHPSGWVLGGSSSPWPYVPHPARARGSSGQERGSSEWCCLIQTSLILLQQRVLSFGSPLRPHSTHPPVGPFRCGPGTRAEGGGGRPASATRPM